MPSLRTVWTASFSDRVRTRIIHALRRTVGNTVRVPMAAVLGEARQAILEQEGEFWLSASTMDPGDDFFDYLRSCDDDMFPTVVESLVSALEKADRAENEMWPQGWPGTFTRDVNEFLAQERVGWEVTDGRMVEIHSKELHTSVVEPALRLLHQSGFERADRQYRDALEEISQGNCQWPSESPH